MSDEASAAPGRWRLIDPGDALFLYELICRVDPRWWRFSREGLEPNGMLGKIQSIAAGVLVEDADGRPVAAAVLADAGASGTGNFEYFALPEPRAEEIARHFTGEIIAAAFAGAPVRRLYHDRFETDPDLYGETAGLWEVEVVYPEFAMIEGRYESRTTSVLTRERFGFWTAANATPIPEVER
jgi:hypothetical protein